MGLQTNVGKMVGMVCRTCQAVGIESESADERRMTGEGLSYRERQRVRVNYSDCVEETAMGFLAVYQHMQHGKAAVGRRKWETTDPVRNPKIQDDFPNRWGPK